MARKQRFSLTVSSPQGVSGSIGSPGQKGEVGYPGPYVSKRMDFHFSESFVQNDKNFDNTIDIRINCMIYCNMLECNQVV